jgi:two-component system phosphate regulon sensor histidine kinase PhoR
VVGFERQLESIQLNPAAEKIFLTPLQTAMSKSILEITRNRHMEILVQQALSENKSLAEEMPLTYGHDRFFRVQVIPIEGQKPRIAGLMVLFEITELIKAERIRKDFVANVSHELKTPLTSIRGFIETLQGGAYANPEQSLNFLTMMEQDTRRLTRLIDDLLELSKLDSKRLTLKLDSIDLVEEIQKALKLFHGALAEKKIQIHFEIPTTSKTLAAADTDKLQQVLINLIDNAVKYNRVEGRILIDIRRDKNFWQISLEDTGCGIPQEAIPHIFERFYRVDKARSRALGGTGLGLAIVKNIIEAHGGSVRCESVLNQGSKFSITLPAG